jgi:hypothetical protein
MDIIGNFFFNNGIADDGFHRNMMFGNASGDHRNVVMESNTAYFPPGMRLGHEYNMLGGDGGSHGLRFTDNWLAHEGRPALQVNRSDGEVIEGNRIVGDVEYTSFDGSVTATGADFEALFPQNEYYRDGNRPAGAWVRVRQDLSLPGPWRRAGLAYVGIVNWDGAAAVDVDLSGVQSLEAGALLRVASVQSRAEAVERAYDGGAVSFPMTGWTPAWPAGRVSGSPLPATFPEFGVFEVRWATGGAPIPREPSRIGDPGAGYSATAAHALRIAAWQVTDAEERAQLLAERRLAWRAQRLGRPL